MSDGNVAFNRERCVAHSFYCPPPRTTSMRLADALVMSYVDLTNVK